MAQASFANEAEHITELRRQIARFGTGRLPREKRIQLDKEHRWDRDDFKALAALGVIGLTIPEKYGGHGQDIVAATAVIEELCQFGTSMAGPYIHAAFYGGMNISENGSKAQKEEMLPKIARGEMLLCYGLSEPNVGGDLPSVETRAERKDGKIIINGAKRWCTGADWSDYIYCLVRSGPAEARYKNLSFLLIPTKAPGVSMSPIQHSNCLLYTSPSPRDQRGSRMPSSA